MKMIGLTKTTETRAHAQSYYAASAMAFGMLYFKLLDELP